MKSSNAEPSNKLIFHVHGGAFVAQTSKSHEVYLREWAAKLDVPIVSIDYSLAPEAPFPRAFEEVFYAYCWALKNPEILGSTGENIVFVGDSAGGNINTACIIKCIEMGIKKPKGIFNIYTPYVISFTITPTRFLTLIDPVIPFGFVVRATKSYAEIRDVEKKDEFNKRKIIYQTLEDEFDIKVHNTPLVSPYLASDEVLKEFPPIKMLTTNMVTKLLKNNFDVKNANSFHSKLVGPMHGR